MRKGATYLEERTPSYNKDKTPLHSSFWKSQAFLLFLILHFSRQAQRTLRT